MYEGRKNKKQPNISRRISAFIVIFGLLLLVIYIKLFDIQIINGSKYRLAAKKQYESKISLKPSRGLIFDRKMNALVSNVNRYSFAADPNMVDNKDSVAELFASVFQKDKNYYIDKLNTKNTSFVWLERRVDAKYEPQLKDLNLSGVIKINESYREYNYEKLASQIIGHTDIDNVGVSGVELECNETLSGKDGFVIMQKDGLGRKRPAVEYPRSEPVNGNNYVLTIDMNIQKVIEEELGNGILVDNADGGKCIVMSVKTGEILGMSSIGNNDGVENFGKLAMITDLYEPGSTFKVVTAAASLEEGIEDKSSIIQTYGGEYLINGIKLKDSHKFSTMTFQQVIEQSSNIGVSQVAVKLGPEKFYKYARDFGFGITTGIDLPGEVKGILKRPVEYSPVSLRFNAIGYEVLVTALQMANSYACVANDGVLMQPYLIKRELSADGTLIREYKPTIIRNVISKTTAKTLTELLVGVVERGTGVEAKIEGVKIAGKTGTSQKLVNGEYSKQNYNASFIGYFPAENPQIIVAVILDAPKTGSYYGGKAAAPIFKKIAERIITLTGLHEYSHPELDGGANISAANYNQQIEETKTTNELNLINFDIGDAVRMLKEKNIDYEIEGPKKNAYVINQEVLESTGTNQKIRLVTANQHETGKSIKESDIVMPDMKGLSLRKCIKLISSLGIEFKINGSGKVITQKPEPGATLNKNQLITINCENTN
jgi:cell division protein FtsI/penicillin-binding protein 2